MLNKTPIDTMKVEGNDDGCEDQCLQLEEKGIKNLKSTETLENEHAKKKEWMIQQFQGFIAPLCGYCQKRSADRVCINMECGYQKHQQLICGNCHSEVHSKSLLKPEIGIDEYLSKLSSFLSESTRSKSEAFPIHMESDHLAVALSEINRLRQRLHLFKDRISSEINSYESNQQQQGKVEKCIENLKLMKEYKSIQEELKVIRLNVLFRKNSFVWNNPKEKLRQLSLFSDMLSDNVGEIERNLLKACYQEIKIDLSDSKCLTSNNIGCIVDSLTQIDAIDGMFRLQGNMASENGCQYYLNEQLEWKKKYKLRFRFESEPNTYIMVGVMPYSLVESNWVFGIKDEYFCKLFFSNNPPMECSRILRGRDLSTFPRAGTQIEVRVDFQNNMIDFSDYPNQSCVNTNFLHWKFRKEPYVFAFAFYQYHSIIVEELAEISVLQEI